VSANGYIAGTSLSTGTQVNAYYAEGVDVQTTSGVVGARYQLFDRWPLSFRLSVGVGRMFESVTGAGNYLVGNETIARSFGHYSGFIPTWSVLVMPEVRFGYRVSSSFVVDLGVGLMLMNVGALPHDTSQRAPDGLDDTPPRASLGGIGWALPLTAAIRLEL
jgi:hypothetical protein